MIRSKFNNVVTVNGTFVCSHPIVDGIQTATVDARDIYYTTDYSNIDPKAKYAEISIPSDVNTGIKNDLNTYWKDNPNSLNYALNFILDRLPYKTYISDAVANMTSEDTKEKIIVPTLFKHNDGTYSWHVVALDTSSSSSSSSGSSTSSGGASTTSSAEGGLA